ncbi:hypothetical protein ERO13_A07G041400v2 [Gossypium hirsutum]|uniref:Major facilitator superfamily (MFS) profile domain-containing protein n=5 Tax=Gossypium TaxID=3633 RepID=A0ABR0P8Q8_GOSAR|nr:putative glycerol-3-phosphate transporter 1 [Gossypium hirsutum]XP_017623490.1 putative glycerol-3-phosphate transporter 1 [Gossypium arboreum]KAB2072880.1 hypothetical protein ES319_A07G047500v1 [Gossypium barbadense]TYH08852.1 hypothetical protein ES288_A07G049800v1 [Gossypium darwinii]TYI17789.1 hypothetical protein ES332_A07G049200v1 [Gossypium tomentosum]KAG4190610.1 hypothetical protein ERO13_A07G041400v2 [Gossypium hirsutum]KAK5817598.1 hypothetical protein PVK06_022525 [Gossypium a
MGSEHELPADRSYSKPLGIRFLEYIKKAKLSYESHQAIVLIVTFFAYASYHATRKTTSIVKSALDPQSSDVGLKFPWRITYLSAPESKGLSWVLGDGWAPFNGSDGTALLGQLDVAFLSVYALGMYFSGHMGDRMNLRIFLTVGMVGTGLFTSLFGAGYWAKIHSFYYYLIVQMIAGLFQSTGWPSVVAVVGKWFGKKKRGLIMGIWNAHTSVGNITGSLIASALLSYGWGWSFVVPGLLIAFMGLVVFFFLPVSPESVGAYREEDEVDSLRKNEEEEGVTEPLLGSNTELKEKAVGFIEAWKIPGVAPFAFCLFFAKLVAYTFLYWLPYYISHTAIEGKYLSNEAAGNLSTFFDIGGVLGGILAGHISDRLDARAITAATFMYCAIPALYFYRSYGHVSLVMNVALMFICGMFVNGPYALITTAVSADLGTHSSLRGSSKALATVTAIIDGTGSVGAAIGPLLTGYISAESWSAVFTMLMGAALVAGLLLTRLVVAEVAARISESRSQGGSQTRSEAPELDV